jgi:hypothetical protein
MDPAPSTILIIHLVRYNEYGRMYINNDFLCIARENPDTLIPTGIYYITIYNSPAMGHKVPLISVPGRRWIEIHAGTRSTGCILIPHLQFEQLMHVLPPVSLIEVS